MRRPNWAMRFVGILYRDSPAIFRKADLKPPLIIVRVLRFYARNLFAREERGDKATPSLPSIRWKLGCVILPRAPRAFALFLLCYWFRWERGGIISRRRVGTNRPDKEGQDVPIC